MDTQSAENDLIEILAAVVLSAAGLLTSWAGYQSALWDGAQAGHYAQAGVLRQLASREALEADARQAVSIQMFGAWLEAAAQGDGELADFHRQRFPPEMRPAFEAWLALRPLENAQAPPSPFAMTNYKLPGREQGAELDRRAEEAYRAGERANQVSDAFVQATLILANALFFAGIGQVFRLRAVRLSLIGIAGFACVIGLVRILSLPAQAP